MQSSDDTELIDGVPVQRITPLDALDPFLMTVVSNSDLWMFVSSSGGLTAGRVEPADCVFPYETDDRLHRSGGRVGPVTVLRVERDGRSELWRPFVGDAAGRRRSVLKSLRGNAVFFEEEDARLGFTFRYRWAPSDRFGWVRTATLLHHDTPAPGSAVVHVVDGLVGLMPWGVDVGMQQSMSNLVNAYRRSEVVESVLGIFTLEALVVDRPEPAEALRATTVWTTGLPGARVGVDPRALIDVERGGAFEATELVTGRPGAHLVAATVESRPGATHRWHIAADVAQSHSAIARLLDDVRRPDELSKAVDDDIDRCSERLVDIVAGADGSQCTASPVVDAHHAANTLFNVMRGGTFPNGSEVRADSFRAFVAARNTDAARRHAAWLAELPDRLDVADLRARAGRPGDPDLARLAHEYLPLAFSRRHGDPSRPWNHFAIRVRDADGEPVMAYQGNWRDIFQNWEALCRTYPDYLPSIIAKFVNASTGDGFNPYRITSDGIDWEVPEPDKPWSGIGYWGDHQIVYLYRLLLAQQQHDPSWLRAELGRRIYSYADVPYRIVSFDRLVRDPKRTVEFDRDLHDEIDRRVSRIGADGRLAVDDTDGVIHVSLLEKLLVPALSKLSNFVADGGIWMNTQRPEWNDANNALVGSGTSMVTLAHLRRYLQLLEEVTTDVPDTIPVSADVVTWIERVLGVLEAHESTTALPTSTVPTSSTTTTTTIDDDDDADLTRGRILRDLGTAFDEYRTRFYEAGPSGSRPLPSSLLRRLLRTSRHHLDASLRSARRPDGLYDSYNLLAFSPGSEAVTVERLPAMLEGQVAVIGSGVLEPSEVSRLVEAMYASDLHRSDLDTFVLYPATPRPSFLDRNLIPAEAVNGDPLLRALVESGDQDVVVRDVNSDHHFAAHLRNAHDLDAALDLLADDDRVGHLVEARRRSIHALFEHVFDHHRFTGRSATMYAYEGIGSVYWHMVTKLLLAVQEVILDAGEDTTAETLAELTTWYDRIRGGLGFNKSAAEYGAFPTDPYSHSPAGAGAQQPGMTGQVKEALLVRRAELGLTVTEGRVRISPRLLSASELRDSPGTLEYLDVAGRPCRVEVPAGSAGFTVCRVPVVIHASDEDSHIVVTDRSGARRTIPGLVADIALSADLFGHRGEVTRIDVTVPVGSMGR
ncbi:MAG: hypothetical protein RLZZ01_1532 [Actinomycetota bacterium]